MGEEQQREEELRVKLEEDKARLDAIEQMLLRKPDNDVLLKLRADMEQVIDLTKSLLQLKSEKKRAAAASSGSITVEVWSAGQRVLARWSDGGWHSARVLAVTPATDSEARKKLYRVLFLEYGEEAEVSGFDVKAEPVVLKRDISPGLQCLAIYAEDGLMYDAEVKSITSEGLIVEFTDYKQQAQVGLEDIKLLDATSKKRTAASSSGPEFTEEFVIPERLKPMASDTEAQRQAKRKKLKKLKFLHSHKQTASKKRRTGFLTKVDRESMFKTPDTVDGKVGVVGSGRGMTEFHSVGKVTFSRGDEDDQKA